MKNLLAKLERGIEAVENKKVPLFYLLLTFIFAVTLRNFLEIFLTESELVGSTFLHSYLFFINLALVILLLIVFYLKTPLVKAAKIVIPGFFALLIAPLIDLLLSRSASYNIAYLLPDIHSDLFTRYVTFFGSFTEVGVTLGVRIEIALILLFGLFYAFFKARKVFTSLLFTVLLYSFIFLYLTMPFWVQAFFSLLGVDYLFSDALMVSVFLFLAFLLGVILYAHEFKDYFWQIMADFRWFRLAHYLAMFILGAKLASSSGFLIVDHQVVFGWVFSLAAIAFAWLFSVMSNNSVDRHIDLISNPNRPTVTNAVPAQHYKIMTWLSFTLALVFGLAVNYLTFFFILLFIGNYFIYSMPPIRFKRVTFFSKFTISLNSWILFILGSYFVSGDFLLTSELTVFFLIGLTFVNNFIDIKDYEGDKAAGIKTIPGVFGLKKAKFLIGLAYLFLYMAAYFVFQPFLTIDPSYVLAGFIFLGLVQFFLVNRKNYDEKPIFLVNLLSYIFLIIFSI